MGRPNKQKSIIFEKFLLYFHTYLKESKCMVRMSIKPSTKILKFMTAGKGVQALWIRWPYSENVLNLRKSFSTSIFILDKTKCLVTMSMNSCTEIVKFMVPWSEVQAFDQEYGHMVKNVLYIKEIFSTFTAGEDKLNAWLWCLWSCLCLVLNSWSMSQGFRHLGKANMAT